MRTTVTVTRTSTSELLYLCKHCGLNATALVTAKASASSTGSTFRKPDDPSAMAAEVLREKSRQMIRMAPCPHCRKRDDVAVRVFRNKQRFVAVCFALATALGGLVFSGTNLIAVLTLVLFLAGLYAYSQWDLWSRSPRRVHFDFIEPAPEPVQLPVARVVKRIEPPSPPPPRKDIELEEVRAVEPTPFDDGPSVLK